MTNGHAVAQDSFLEIGRALGFIPRRTFSETAPTDGIWLLPMSIGRFRELPVAAIEVVASEGLKTWRGSIHTLEVVSPAVGYLLLQDEEVRRRLARSGKNDSEIEATLGRTLDQMREAVAQTRQRIEVLQMENLRYLHRLYVKKSRIA